MTAPAPRPRTAVIGAAWRAQVEVLVDDTDNPFGVFSGRDGGPLARTVKCIIDPLVLRLRANPEWGKPLLDADAAAEVVEAIAAAADTIGHAGRWFAVLKARRRAAGITGGNIQEQYFPRAYELAVTHGAPGEDAAGVADEMLVDIHQPSAGMSVDDLAAYLERNLAELDAALDAVWSQGDPPAEDTDVTEAAEVMAALLDEDIAASERNTRFAALVASALPEQVGSGFFGAGASVTEVLAVCGVVTDSVASPTLSSSAPASMPALRGRSGELPLDRSIATRVTTTLRRSRDREELPPLAELVDDEITRSRQPWALDGPVWQAAALVGVVVAAQLNPLAPQPSPHGFVQAMSARLSSQAHIMYNRRFLLDSSAGDDSLAAGLRAFWRPYLNRLWVRLHGRAVTEPATTATEFDADSLLDLLDGIARSVSFDQRSAIRAAIEKAAR